MIDCTKLLVRRTQFLLFLGLLIGLVGCGQPAESESEGATTPATESTPAPPESEGASDLIPTEADKAACKAVVNQILEYAQKGENKKAADILVYRGDDEARRWKDICRYDDPQEQVFVDKTLATIQVIADGLASHDFTEFILEKEYEGVWYVWLVDLKYDNGNTNKQAFAMLKIGDRFALGDME
ncbi:MAG: hypothetical protein AAGN35_11140 [Bacteroidota bacterium]